MKNSSFPFMPPAINSLKHSVIGIFLGVCLLLPSLGMAGGQGKILILNSNASIAKYDLLQKEFEAYISVPFISVDLAGKMKLPEELNEKMQNYGQDLIFCIGSNALVFAEKNLPNQKRVFASVINWRRFPIGNATFGVSNELLAGMQATTLRYLFPKLENIGVIYSPRLNKEWYELARQEARQVGMKLVGHPIESPDELDDALEELLPKVQALWLIADPVVISSKAAVQKIFRESDSAQRPVFAYNELFAQYGAALVLSVDLPTMARQAAMLSESLLAQSKGGVPEKVQPPAGSYIAVNANKTEKYNLKVSEEAMSFINKIIE